MVAIRIFRAMQFGSIVAHLALNVVACCHAVGLQVAGRFQKILEFHPLIAANTGHRRGPCKIAVGKFINHGVFENIFIIKHIVRKTALFSDAAGIVNINPRTASAFFRQSCPVIIELQRDPNHIIALIRKIGGDHGTVDAPGHRHHHAGFSGRFGKAKGVQWSICIQCHQAIP